MTADFLCKCVDFFGSLWRFSKLFEQTITAVLEDPKQDGMQQLKRASSVYTSIIMKTKPKAMECIRDTILGHLPQLFDFTLLVQPLHHGLRLERILGLWVVSLVSWTLTVPTQLLNFVPTASVSTAKLVCFISITLDKWNKEEKLTILVQFALVIEVDDHPIFNELFNTFHDHRKNGMVICCLVIFFVHFDFILIRSAITIQLMGSNVTWFDKHLFATMVFFGVVGHKPKDPPSIFLVTCLPIQEANGHLHCRHLQLVELSSDSPINIEWKSRKNLSRWVGN